MKLVENWRAAWKMWTVRLSTIGASFMGIFLYFPDSALYLYNSMPEEIRSLLPERFGIFIAFVIFVGTAISRIVKQEKLARDNKELQSRLDEQNRK